MPPKKRPAKESLVKGPSQAGTNQDHNIIKATVPITHIPQTSHPHTSTESHATTVEATNTVIPDPPLQNNQDPQLKVKAGIDQHQDSEEEIEVTIENELARLCQENERLRLKQEHMATRREAMQRATSCSNRLNMRGQGKQSCNKL
jgi:hypothetical protein